MLFAVLGYAQVVDATHMGGPVLLKSWRIQAGDDPRWAATDFDDSSWRVISAEKQWDDLGIGNLRGYVWFRTRVMIPEHAGRLGLTLWMMGPSEIFADGKRIGFRGKFPPHGLYEFEVPKAYDFDPGNSRSTEVAIRVWIWPALNRIGRAPGDILIGPASVVQQVHELDMRQILDGQISSLVLQVLYFVLAGGLLVLFVIQKQVEYVWLAVAILTSVVNGVVDEITLLDGLGGDTQFSGYIDSSLSIVGAVCLLEFIFRFLKEPTPKWARVYQTLLVVSIVRTYAGFHSWISLTDSNVLHLFLYLPYWFAIPFIVLWRYLRGNKEAGLLAVPMFLMFAMDVADSLHWVLWRLRIRQDVAPFFPNINLGLVSMDPADITEFLFFLSIGALIIYRFQKVRLEQVRAKAELEAARSMQEVMVPSTVTAPGFQIESAYLPAQEVGGDFFQIFPGEDGSVFIIIGDVSGKGLKAAMLVSLTLGLLRRTLKDTRQPAEVLADVNDLLVEEIEGRFVTCCCARMHPDGRLILANAGHLSPYCAGVEIPTPGNVPLGLSSGVDYQTVEFQVPNGERVLFLSDGVVEARSRTGELYGFERTRVISVQPARQIADIAQKFGQEDDITVLAIQREPMFA